MKTIDLHAHLGDIFCGHQTSFHRTTKSKPAHWLPRLNEFLSFYPLHNSLLRKLESSKKTWDFIKDCVGISDVDHLTHSLNQSEIDYACVLALEPNVKTDWVIAQAKKEPRIIPILSIHPYDGPTRGKVKEYVQKGCKALKLHPVIQGFSPRSKEVFDLVEEVKPHGIPVICHTGCFSIPHLEKRKEQGNIENFIPLIDQFPEVSFIMCHMNLLEPERAISVAKRFGNVYLETSWQTPQNIRRAIRAVGSIRVVFGSDWPYASQSASLSVVRKACKRDSSLQNVLWNNAKRLLNLDRS